MHIVFDGEWKITSHRCRYYSIVFFLKGKTMSIIIDLQPRTLSKENE
jgi:hypothetical protein